MELDNLGQRFAIYGANLAGGIIGHFIGAAGMGNPTGAVAYGVLDSLGAISERINSNKITRLAKLAGSAIYGISAIADISNLSSNPFALVDLGFDASMAYRLGRDTFDNYYYENADLLDDFGIKKGKLPFETSPEDSED